MLSVKWRGREVENPALRPLVAALLIAFGSLAAVVGVIGAVLEVMLMAVLIPLSLPLHLLLRLLGRRGFLAADGARFSYRVDRQGLSKAP